MATFEWGEALPRLDGPRVVLRGLTDADAEAVLAVFGDPDVMRFWSSPPLEGLESALELIGEIRQGFDEKRLFQWGISLRESGVVAGTCTLYNIDLPHRRGEVGFALRRDLWGQGLASEALEALLRFSFEALELHRVEADVDPENAASLRVLERQGFRREGHLRERWHHLGEVRDGIFLGLLRREWRGGPAVG